MYRGIATLLLALLKGKVEIQMEKAAPENPVNENLKIEEPEIIEEIVIEELSIDGVCGVY